MRIGHFCGSIWAPGGVASYIRRVSDWQRAHGNEVVFLTEPDDRQGVSADGRTAEIVTADGALLRRAAELRLDLLHVHHEVDVDLAKSDVPVVRTVHGHHPYCPSGSRFFRRWGVACDRRFTAVGCTWGYLVDRCGSARPQQLLAGIGGTRREQRSLAGARCIAVSQFVRSQMLRQGYDAAFIDVLPPPIRKAVATPSARPAVDDPSAPPCLLYAGRLALEKGVDWLLRALARTTAGAALDIAGTGDAADDLKQLTVDLGLDHRVRFLGWVDEARVDDLMATARAVVFPSVWPEPFGLIAPEAMAHGTAVIASDAGGIPESVRDGHDGLVVPAGDVAALATAIDQLSGDPALARQLGEAGRRDVSDRFGLDNHMRQLADVYTKAIADRPTATVSTAAAAGGR